MNEPKLSSTLPGYCDEWYPWKEIIAFFPIVENPTLLEVGCFHGKSTAYWAEHLPQWRIHSVDTFPGYDGQEKRLRCTGEEQFQNFQKVLDRYSTVSYTKGDFSKLVMKKPWDNPTVFFYDGDHSFDATLNALLTMRDTPVIVVDDYEEVWPEVTKAVNLFQRETGRAMEVLGAERHGVAVFG